MATPTEDLVLRVLQDIQGTLADHGRKLSRLESGQNEIRESIVTALAFRPMRMSGTMSWKTGSESSKR
jgi:hypothetical protein